MKQEILAPQDRHELQSLLLGVAYSGINALFSTKEELVMDKILELHTYLKKGVGLMYYGHTYCPTRE